MSKETGVIALGFLVAVMPLLGFPESWRVAFFFIAGAALVVIGFLMRSQALSRRTREVEPGFTRTFEQSYLSVERTFSDPASESASADSSDEPAAQ